MIDISKIKPGDKVTLVPLEVADVGVDFRHPRILVRLGGVNKWLDGDQIAAHHPAPREFQVGDRVRHERGADGGKVLGIDGGRIYVLWPDHPGAYPFLPSQLTLVEAGQ